MRNHPGQAPAVRSGCVKRPIKMPYTGVYPFSSPGNVTNVCKNVPVLPRYLVLRGPEKGSLLKLPGPLVRCRLPAGERHPLPATLLPAPAGGPGRRPHRAPRCRCRPPLPSPRPRSRSPARGGGGRAKDPADEAPSRDKRAAAPAPRRGEAGLGLAAPVGSAPTSPSFTSPTIKHAGAGAAGWRSRSPSPGDGDRGRHGALPALNLPLALSSAPPRGNGGAAAAPAAPRRLPDRGGGGDAPSPSPVGCGDSCPRTSLRGGSGRGNGGSRAAGGLAWCPLSSRFGMTGGSVSTACR